MPDRATLTAGSTPSAGYVALRLRQQELVARFGRFALREDELQVTLDEACRIAAEGLETPISPRCWNGFRPRNSAWPGPGSAGARA